MTRFTQSRHIPKRVVTTTIQGKHVVSLKAVTGFILDTAA